MVNKKYLMMQKRKKDLEILHEKMTPFEINDFYKRCNQKFYKIVESSLESLKRRLYLKYTEINRIGTYVYEESYIDGYIETFPSKLEYRDATDEDEKYILKVKREILDGYGYEFEKQVFLHNKTEDYYQKLNNIYKEEKSWDVVYQCYKIIYDKDTVLKETNNREQRLGLNKVIIEAIDKQAADRVKNKGKDSDYVWEYAAKHDGEIPFYYHPSYEYLQKILSRELLKIKE